MTSDKRRRGKQRTRNPVPGVTIRPYGNGKQEAYRVVLSIGGRTNRSRPSAVVYGSYEHAVNHALKMRRAHRRVTPAERARQTLAGYLLEEWLPAKRKVRQTTREGYEQIIKTTIEPLPLGGLLLTEVEPLDVELWMNQLREKGRPGGKPMSEARLLRCFAVLRAGLRQSVRWRLRTYDATTGVEPPSPPRARVLVPSREELEKIVQAFFDHLLEPAVALAAGAGLRLGETLGLRWSNVDLERGLVRIVETRRAVKGGVVVLPPKSDNSRRDVNLPMWVIDVLREHRQRQVDRGFNVVSGYVVVTSTGAPFHPNEASRRFREVVRRAGIGSFTFHSTRHAHASLGLDDGVELPIMSRRLGHSTIYITDRLYYHPGAQKDREAAARFDNLIRRKRLS